MRHALALMGLPVPIPDNPLKWDGWKHFSSANPYERLCLDTSGQPPDAPQIEDHCRQLLMWWQKKLPLKNQPSNPLAQLLRTGLDEAPARLTEARTLLLDPARRAGIDAQLLTEARERAITEFHKFLAFALTSGLLTADEEETLYSTGAKLGLEKSEVGTLIEAELEKTGARRVPRMVAPPAPPPAAAAAAAPPVAPVVHSTSPRDEFLRMLRLSSVDEMTDDQRDAFCNMGEALGLTGGEAEDVIDDYLDERMLSGAAAPPPPPRTHPARPAGPAAAGASAPAPVKPPAAPRSAAVRAFDNSPLLRAREREQHLPFTNSQGMPMLLVTSGIFLMGSNRPGSLPNEQPPSRTNISAFYLSRWPITNALYEQFDPAHRSLRAPGTDDRHPVVYVSARDAARFCEWLSGREHRRYRLPTEAEWEYAARGTDGRTFPWGETFDSGQYANFADSNTRFPWADPVINDGYAESNPVGVFPKGTSPFGIEEMAGNVWEWCLDCMTPYPGRERTNPRGPQEGARRIVRGGSWKSRLGSLRTTARSFYAPDTVVHDIGFRIVCEI